MRFITHVPRRVLRYTYTQHNTNVSEFPGIKVNVFIVPRFPGHTYLLANMAQLNSHVTSRVANADNNNSLVLITPAILVIVRVYHFTLIHVITFKTGHVLVSMVTRTQQHGIKNLCCDVISFAIAIGLVLYCPSSSFVEVWRALDFQHCRVESNVFEQVEMVGIETKILQNLVKI